MRVQSFRANLPFCRRVDVEWGHYPNVAGHVAATPDLTCTVVRVPTVSTVR